MNMNQLLSAATTGGMAADIKQNDEDIITDVVKLEKIVSSLADAYLDFIVEIYVAPMNIIQMKTSKLQHIEFYIVYDESYDGPLFAIKKECNEFLTELVRSEFEGISKIDKISYSKEINWNVPTLLMHTVARQLTIEDIPDTEYIFLYNMIMQLGCALTIPRAATCLRMKNIIVHSPSTVLIPMVEKLMRSYCEKNGVSVSELGENKNDTDIIYQIMVGLKPIHYDIPYMYIDKNSFNEQRLETILK